jgi:uncharacterized protein YkwD
MPKAGVLIYLIILIAIGGAFTFMYYIEKSGGTVSLECPRKEPDYSTTTEKSRDIIAYINGLRVEAGVKNLTFDETLYRLAEKRVNDMINYKYYAYTNPYTGKCVDDLKGSLGFRGDQNIRESINGLAGIDYYNPCLEWEREDWHGVVDVWMSSRTQRNNLLYAGHEKGAVACKFDKCVFLGLNSQGYETRCY